MLKIVAPLLVSILSCSAYGMNPSDGDARLREFSGWWRSRDAIEKAPLNEQWQAKYDANKRREKDYGDLDSNLRRCIPNGLPSAFGMEVAIWRRGNALVILGGHDDLRRILLDRSTHTPEDKLQLTYEGESIAHWEGNALVVDTIGLKRSNELATGVGNVKLHVVERIYREGPALKIETRVEDPYALSKPWLYTRTFSAEPARAITELYCVQSLDRTFDAETGAQTFRLGNHEQDRR